MPLIKNNECILNYSLKICDESKSHSPLVLPIPQCGQMAEFGFGMVNCKNMVLESPTRAARIGNLSRLRTRRTTSPTGNASGTGLGNCGDSMSVSVSQGRRGTEVCIKLVKRFFARHEMWLFSTSANLVQFRHPSHRGEFTFVSCFRLS